MFWVQKLQIKGKFTIHLAQNVIFQLCVIQKWKQWTSKLGSL